MDESLFHELADELLQTLADAIEAADEEGLLEVDLMDTVLNIHLEDGSEYVINKHEPSLQIWVSSPVSGASYFTYDEDDELWRSQDDSILIEMIAEELGESCGISIDI